MEKENKAVTIFTFGIKMTDLFMTWDDDNDDDDDDCGGGGGGDDDDDDGAWRHGVLGHRQLLKKCSLVK